MEELYAGIRLACEEYDVDIVGGDTSASYTGPVSYTHLILNAFAWPLTVYRKQRVFIVYCVDYQGI